jgi:hypothetical protein
LRAEAQTKKRGEAQGAIVSTNLLHQTFRQLLDIVNNKYLNLRKFIISLISINDKSKAVMLLH